MKEALEALYIYPLHHILLPWDEAHCWLTPSIRYSQANKELVDPLSKISISKQREKDFRCLWDGQSYVCGNEHNQNSFSIKSGCLCQ